MTRTRIASTVQSTLLTVVMVAAGIVAPSHFAGWPTARAEDKDPSNVVAIDNFTFTPSTLTVSKGTTVTWVNRDDTPHTVASTEKKFKSAALDTDERFSFTFTEAGTYDYYCSLHPKMTAKVVVK